MDKEIFDLLVRAGELALKRQNQDGSMPSGKNGPHNHNMTPARNTGHCSILFTYLFKLTKKKKWKKASIKCIEKLLQLRPLNGSFHHRNEHYKCGYNGLIGQAWSIEALIYSAKILGERKYLIEAKKVLKLHKFNDGLSLWHELDLHGYARGISMTLNQQIWFMAVALKSFKRNNKMISYANSFLNNIGKYLRTRNNGLLYTAIYADNKHILKTFYKEFSKLYSQKKRERLDYGYHSFVLVGLGELFEMIPSHNFFKSKKFIRILKFCFSSKFKNNVIKSKFGYGYNVTGLEVAYIYSVFKNFLSKNEFKVAHEMFEYQIKNHFSEINKGLLANNSQDIETLAVRLYEVYRIKNSFWRWNK